MRVIAGKARGRILRSRTGRGTRPTTDRVKEAIFNILHSYLPGAVFLDLYAGFGGIGIEALSRGAARVDFVEKRRANCKIIKENLNLVGFSEKARVHCRDVKRFVIDAQFDIIFMDPPYNKGLISPTLEHIVKYNLNKEDSFVVIEHSPREAIIEQEFVVVKQKSYGDTMISYLKKN